VEKEMLGEKWTILWNEYAADTYLYGSQVVYHSRDDVEFRNRLMPPGTVIKEWYSKVNFQLQRIEPALPMIDGESRYRITVEIDSPGHAGCLVRLVFFDRYEVEAGSVTVRGDEMDFRCPLKTYSYRMQLINGGVEQFHFHRIIIQEVLDGKESNVKKIK
jgi:accessory secretory protein Asp3